MSKKSSTSKSYSQHYKDDGFLKALGAHCKQLRVKKGLSIDRVSKASSQLSSSVIQRLETGAAPVSISVLERFAQALNLPIKKLLDFEYTSTEPIEFEYDQKHQILPFVTHLPLYSLKAAAGYFGNGEKVDPIKWVKAPKGLKLSQDLFAVEIKGDSMEPKIKNKAIVVLRAAPKGSKQNKIVLVEYRDVSAPESGGNYVIKKYKSFKKNDSRSMSGLKTFRIELHSLNKKYTPIVLQIKNEDEVRVLAEYICSL